MRRLAATIGLCVILAFLAAIGSIAADDNPPRVAPQAPQFPPVGRPPIPPVRDAGEAHVFPEALANGWPQELPDVIGPSAVFPPDERWRVTPATAFPFHSIAFIARLDAAANLVSTCSAAFIGP